MAWATTLASAPLTTTVSYITEHIVAVGSWAGFLISIPEHRIITQTTNKYAGIAYSSAASLASELANTTTYPTVENVTMSDPIGGGCEITQVLEAKGDWIEDA